MNSDSPSVHSQHQDKSQEDARSLSLFLSLLILPILVSGCVGGGDDGLVTAFSPVGTICDSAFGEDSFKADWCGVDELQLSQPIDICPGVAGKEIFYEVVSIKHAHSVDHVCLVNAGKVVVETPKVGCAKALVTDYMFTSSDTASRSFFVEVTRCYDASDDLIAIEGTSSTLKFKSYRP